MQPLINTHSFGDEVHIILHKLSSWRDTILGILSMDQEMTLEFCHWETVNWQLIRELICKFLLIREKSQEKLSYLLFWGEV